MDVNRVISRGCVCSGDSSERFCAMQMMPPAVILGVAGDPEATVSAVVNRGSEVFIALSGFPPAARMTAVKKNECFLAF